MNQKLKRLNAVVYQDASSLLKANAQLCERLLAELKNKQKKKKINVILVTSKLVLLHLNDLINKALIETGISKPSYALGDVETTIREMVEFVRLTSDANKDVKVNYDPTGKHKLPSPLFFDKRKFQTVILNLLLYIVKFTLRKSKIRIVHNLNMQGSVKNATLLV